MTAPRRWSFGLRTLLLAVTVAAGPLVWVGHSLNWIRARHDFLKHQRGQCVRFQADGEDGEAYKPLAPAALWMFGEPGASGLWIRDADFAEAKKLFPEAIIESRRR